MVLNVILMWCWISIAPMLLPSRFPWSNYIIPKRGSVPESALALANLLSTSHEGHFAEIRAFSYCGRNPRALWDCWNLSNNGIIHPPLYTMVSRSEMRPSGIPYRCRRVGDQSKKMEAFPLKGGYPKSWMVSEDGRCQLFQSYSIYMETIIDYYRGFYYPIHCGLQ